MIAALRRTVPLLMLPLWLVACGLAGAPWLRAYPAAVLAVPLFGAAALSTLLPVVVVGVGARRLWLTALIDLVAFVFYVMLAALREPAGFADLWTGLVHGPSQILTFALPLVSPRTLLVAPVALCWLCGAVIGECVARGWQTVVPYVTALVVFGVAYAGSERAVTSAADGRRYDTLLAAALLLTLLLLRAINAWVDQDQSAESTEPGAVLPLRALAIGGLSAVVVAAAAAGAIQSTAFPSHPAAPARTPPVDTTTPLTPLSFIAKLRPSDPSSPGTPVFDVTFDQAASRYVQIGDVDSYDGDSWSFTRTFRPSGGVIPRDPDPGMNPPEQPVTQEYAIDNGPLATAPWMPYLDRPQRVRGLGVNIDPTSGMIVPAAGLHGGAHYSVQSLTPQRTLDQLFGTALPGTSYEPVDLQLPFAVSNSLPSVLASLAKETHTPDTSPIPFLRAVAADLRSNYALSGAPEATASTSSPASGDTRPAPSSPTPDRTPTPGSTAAPTRTAGTSFAAVLASILGTARTATPEQYATLVAVLARQLHVPARVATGFRLPTTGASSTVPAGTYHVTSADAWSWVEIPIQGRGWMVLDPSPGHGSTSPQTPTASARPTTSAKSPPPQHALVTRSNRGGHALAPKGHVSRHPSTPVLLTLAVALAALVGLIALAVALLLVRKRLRMRRRRSGDARRRLVGAWQETIDLLVESGLPDVTCLTGAEIAAAAKEAFGAEPAVRVRDLGERANTAIFSPATWIGPAEADAAWNSHLVLRRSVRRRLSVLERVRARLRYNRPSRRTPVSPPASWAAAARERPQSRRKAAGRHARRRPRAH